MEQPWLPFYDKRTSPTLTYPDKPLDTLLSEAARQYPNNTATRFVLRYLLGGRLTVGGTLTYRQLDAHVSQFAAALYRLGVRKGDRVGVMLPNSPHFIIAFFGAMRLGAVVVNINPTYTARELKHQLNDAGAETIVLLNLFWSRFEEARAETPVKRAIVADISDTLPFPWGLLVNRSQRRGGDWVEVPATAGQAHYLGGVMRRAVGDAVLLFNGRDGEWAASIAGLRKDRCMFLPERQTRPQEPMPGCRLLVAR